MSKVRRRRQMGVARSDFKNLDIIIIVLINNNINNVTVTPLFPTCQTK